MLCIRNGTLVTPAGRERADLYVEDGKIAAVGGEHPADESYDAAGCLIFSGFIDAHTHFEMYTPATRTADDFESGTAAALAGGTTSVLDFVTQDRGGTLQAALDTWHSRADGHSSCDYGFHMSVTDWNEKTKSEIPDMARQGVTSFKAYMAYDHLRLTDEELRALFFATKDIGIVGVHCELGDEVNRGIARELAAGHTGPDAHPRSRPPEVEAMAVRRCLALAAEVGGRAWIVHLSAGGALAETEAARFRGQPVLVETCPQYLTLTEEVYRLGGFEAAKYVCSPPLRSDAERRLLWEGLCGGMVDIISTDHCSYRYAGQKELGRGDFTKIPNGLPAVEHRPALLWTAGVGTGRMTPERMAAMLSETPARAFGLWPRKGALLPGSDADLVIWDTEYRGHITAADMQMKADYSPWEGFDVTGRAKAVFLRGMLCAENGRVIQSGAGRYLAREKAVYSLEMREEMQGYERGS